MATLLWQELLTEFGWINSLAEFSFNPQLLFIRIALQIILVVLLIPSENGCVNEININQFFRDKLWSVTIEYRHSIAFSKFLIKFVRQQKRNQKLYLQLLNAL